MRDSLKMRLHGFKTIQEDKPMELGQATTLSKKILKMPPGQRTFSRRFKASSSQGIRYYARRSFQLKTHGVP